MRGEHVSHICSCVGACYSGVRERVARKSKRLPCVAYISVLQRHVWRKNVCYRGNLSLGICQGYSMLAVTWGLESRDMIFIYSTVLLHFAITQWTSLKWNRHDALSADSCPTLQYCCSSIVLQRAVRLIRFVEEFQWDHRPHYSLHERAGSPPVQPAGDRRQPRANSESQHPGWGEYLLPLNAQTTQQIWITGSSLTLINSWPCLTLQNASQGLGGL